MKVVIMEDMKCVIGSWQGGSLRRRSDIDRAIANQAGIPGRAGADILAYREDSSFAVARALGLHHQT
jgi:hypothetical protein